MKKVILTMLIAFGALTAASVPNSYAYNFGDFRSETLTTKAWEALAKDDLEGVLAYTNKCIELYAEQAKKMQDSLKEYPTGPNDQIFAYWALNDVATSLFIQGEAYRKAGKMDEAKQAYQRAAKEFTFGQAWDTKGWFWKPAEASKEKLTMIETGSTLDFGDYSSQTLTTKAWEASGKDDLDGVIAYTTKVMELFEPKAKEMQASLAEYPWESKEEIFKYWALNDVGTSLFIKAEALQKAGKQKEAKEAYKQLVEGYYYAQCWDPKGWFWKPAEAAREKLDELGEK